MKFPDATARNAISGTGFDKVLTYVCHECGKAAEVAGQRVEINDDTCRWVAVEDEPPIAVMWCVCGRHPDVDEDGVASLCGRRSPMRSNGIAAAIVAWNEMVDPGE
jgi:hypothetical protein